MSPRPISYVKAHPWATVLTFGGGMVFGPWLLGTTARLTGVRLSLPSYGNGG